MEKLKEFLKEHNLAKEHLRTYSSWLADTKLHKDIDNEDEVALNWAIDIFEKIAEDLSVQAVVEMPTYEDFAEGRVYSYTFENIGGVEYEMFINEQSWLVIVAENGAEMFRADFTEDGYKRAVNYIDSRELSK